MKFPGNIRLRLTLWYGLVLVVLLLAFSSLVYALLSNNLNRRLDEEIRLRAEHLAGIIHSNDQSGVPGGIKIDPGGTLNFQTQPDETAQVFGPDGSRLLTLGLQAGDVRINAAVALALQGRPNYINTAAVNGNRLRVYAAPLFDESVIIGAVLLGRSTAGVSSVLDTFKNIAFISTLLIVLLAGGGGLFLTNRALRPVIRITRTAREIGDGDLNRRIEVPDGDEIGRLAATLNNMFDRLQSAFVRERRFTSDASHELRTPLAIIEAEATLALEKTRSSVDYKKALGAIAQEAVHMSRIINDLLYLARNEAGKEQLILVPIFLGDFIKDLASDVSVLCRRKKIRLKVERLNNPIIQGDATRLRQLFLNILENAIRYTAPRGTISITLTTQDSMAVVKIADTGIGIPPGELGHIFEPFFRVDPGRARSEGGSGLGLAIVQRIAEEHGGRVDVESELNKGSLFSVFLPVNLADQPESALPAKDRKTTGARRSRWLFWRR